MYRQKGLSPEEILLQLRNIDEQMSDVEDENNVDAMLDKDYCTSTSDSDEEDEAVRSCTDTSNRPNCNLDYPSTSNIVPDISNDDNIVRINVQSTSNIVLEKTNVQNVSRSGNTKRSCLSSTTSSKAKRKRKQCSPTEEKFPIGRRISSADGTEWEVVFVSDNRPGRLQSQNILREKSGPTSYAKRNIETGEVSTAFKLLIDNSMMRHIKQMTELEANTELHRTDWRVSLEELDAFISILYARGALQAKSLPVEFLWSNEWGPSFFRETMTRDRFNEIKRFIRFDNKSTRSERLKTDKFALVSVIWNRFIDNSMACFKAGENVTIDEQLFPTKARSPFTQYMASKPDKFGIKFWLAADVDTKYLLNGLPYLGKDDTRPEGERLSENIVLRLHESLKGKGRNITTDNFFTSVSLAKKLQLQKTSLVGTVNRTRREVPADIKNYRMNLHDTMILKNDCCTLTVYQGKPSKSVLLLSSLHPSVDVEKDGKKVPETVKFYNSTKYGVDVLDQMARLYSTKAASRRRPLQVFFNVLDLAGINAWILYQEVTGEKIERRNFLLKLAEELREDFVQQRGICPAHEDDHNEHQDSTSKRRQCQVNLCNGKKTLEYCEMCKKRVCGKCTGKIVKKKVCKTCVE